MDLVFCKDCEYLQLNLISDLCTAKKFFEYDYLDSYEKYEKCADVNKNNDCENFKKYENLILKFVKKFLK